MDKDFRPLLIAVSDVHLRSPDDERAQLLCGLLEQALAWRPQVFLLLGDIFDFCIGGPTYYRKRYEQLFSCMQRLGSAGTRVLFVEGNHEFSMQKFGLSSVEICAAESTQLEIDGTTIAVRHGDLLRAPPSYKIFRTVLKSEIVRATAAAMPARLFESFALSHAKHSRARDVYRTLDLESLMRAAAGWLDGAGAKYGIFGHFHVPYAEPAVEWGGHGGGTILSMDSWDKPNALVYCRAGFTRLIRGGGEWTQIPMQRYLSPK